MPSAAPPAINAVTNTTGRAMVSTSQSFNQKMHMSKLGTALGTLKGDGEVQVCETRRRVASGRHHVTPWRSLNIFYLVS